MHKNAKTSKVKATMKNGVLAIAIPKLEVKKSKAKTIEIIG